MGKIGQSTYPKTALKVSGRRLAVAGRRPAVAGGGESLNNRAVFGWTVSMAVLVGLAIGTPLNAASTEANAASTETSSQGGWTAANPFSKEALTTTRAKENRAKQAPTRKETQPAHSQTPVRFDYSRNALPEGSRNEKQAGQDIQFQNTQHLARIVEGQSSWPMPSFAKLAPKQARPAPSQATVASATGSQPTGSQPTEPQPTEPQPKAAAQPSKPAPSQETANSYRQVLAENLRVARPLAEKAPATEQAHNNLTASSHSPHRDAKVQQAARLYQDANVLHAADEEPLSQGESPDRGLQTPGYINSSGYPHNYSNDYADGCSSGCSEGYYDVGCSEGVGCCPPPARCAPPLIWVAGVEATFLRPDLNSRDVSFEVEDFVNPKIDSFNAQTSAIDSLYVSPRLWLGVQGCKWGVIGRYWHLQAGEGDFDGFVDATGSYDYGRPGAGYFSNSRLEAYTIDLEVTRRFCLNDCWMQFSAGVRHASIQHDQSITGISDVDDGIVFGYSRANRLSRGTGVVLGLYGRKPLFPCSCVHWFYNVRFSTLWGPTETYAETNASIQATAGANAGSVNGAHTAVDGDIFIGEIQLGLEWNYALQCVPARAFFRTAVEYQRWDGGAGFSSATSFAGMGPPLNPTSVATANASALGPQLDLVGLTFGTGLTW